MKPSYFDIPINNIIHNMIDTCTSKNTKYLYKESNIFIDKYEIISTIT